MTDQYEMLGGKAFALQSLQMAGFNVPRWFTVAPNDPMTDLASRLDSLNTPYVAVRSSAVGEDGATHSFAGQFVSFLSVPKDRVKEKILAVRESGRSERVLAYRAKNQLSGEPPVPVALVQEMVVAECSGVAFSADPVSGKRDVAVVAALYGLGTALVGGEADADSHHVDRSGKILTSSIAQKSRQHVPAPETQEGVCWQSVEQTQQTVACLTDAQIRAVAALARQAEAHFGCPQDIEWAWANGTLYLLQSRPITSLGALPDPEDALCLWDNSNISESYSGVTTPLTFSFARRIYEHVYREFCRLLSVPRDRIASSDSVYANMLGLVRGRVYYNLLNWYRVLAMLPGFQLNRTWMEQMMGVKQALPDELVKRVLAEIPEVSNWRERWRVARMVCALARQHWGLKRQIREFYQRLADALGKPKVRFEEMRLEQLAAHYSELEMKLLRRWDAPMVNDFFAMIFFGLLRAKCAQWLQDDAGTLANELVRHSGAIISMEPLRRVSAMAEIVRGDPALMAALREAKQPSDLQKWPTFLQELEGYLEKFGDRCMEELKLESATLRDDPRVLLESIVAVASKPAAAAPMDTAVAPPKVKGFLRRMVFSWILRHARDRVRERENLRFERTRLFGRVRTILSEMGKRLRADGVLDAAEDVFYLELNEVLGICQGVTPSEPLRATVRARRAAFHEFRNAPAPPDRFSTRGPLHRHAVLRPDQTSAKNLNGSERQGTGCCAGLVRGKVRVVLDPKTAELREGEILVARHTDPGWVLLFPLASGLLVERGSLLSHSAIVAREMGLPAVVGLTGLCEWLHTGDEVEMDGKTGIVRKLNL